MAWSQADANGDRCVSMTEFGAMPSLNEFKEWYRSVAEAEAAAADDTGGADADTVDNATAAGGGDRRRLLGRRHGRRLLENNTDPGVGEDVNLDVSIDVLFAYISSGDDCISFDDMALYFGSADGEIGFGGTVQTSCDQGFLGENTYTCTDTCEFLPPLQTCTKLACTDVLGGEYGFDFQTAAPYTVDFQQQYMLSDAVKVQCPAGHMLELRSEKKAGFVIEGLDEFSVIGATSFLAPSSDVESSFSVQGFPEYSITFPAGAWPKAETRPLKLSILDVSKSQKFEKERAALKDAKIMGSGIYFEPSGIVFSKPVEIAIPYDTSKDLGNYALNVHRYRPGTGLEKIALSSQRQSPVDIYAKKIYAETLSFSLYVPLATPPEPVTPAGTPPSQEENVTAAPPPAQPEKKKRIALGVIIAASVGGVAFLLLVTAVYCRCIRNRTEDRKEEPEKKQSAPAAQRGISQQEARKEREPATSPDIPRNAAKQRGDLERSLPEASEPAPAVTFSSRYAPELPPPEEEAPVLQMESPRNGRRTTPPITPNAPIRHSEVSPQVLHLSRHGLLCRLFAPKLERTDVRL